jgi:putative ABC transport system substrate-binding protein
MTSPARTASRAGPFRIVFLFTALSEPVVQTNIGICRQALAELGYIDGRTITYEGFDAERDPARFPALAREIVALRPDVVLCQKPQAALALKDATSTIPIVFVGLDALGDGVVTDLARPGGNLTGITNAGVEVSGKRLQLLKEAAPTVSRVAVVRDLGEPGPALSEMDKVAKPLGLEIFPANLRTASELESALDAAVAGRADALVQTSGLVVGNQGGVRVAEFAIQKRWPTIAGGRGFVVGGGLLSYSVTLNEPWRRAAIFVDRILKGAWPGELPVEGPTGSTFEISACTAAKIGLTIPPSVLAQASEVLSCGAK